MNPFFYSFSPILIPLVLIIGAWFSGKPCITKSIRRIALRVVSLSIVISAILITTGFFMIPESTQAGLLSLNKVNVTVLLLVSFMAVVLLRFSERYLDTEKHAHQYWRWLLLSLSSVTIVIMSNNLLLLWLGWVSISLCFHRLLLFYPDRPRAVLAAHKKFILARLAELCLLTAILMLYWQHETFQLNTILNHYLAMAETTELSLTEKLAAFLIAQTALIKCAQLPLHGWLIQVVEAPTPISALLHAGIINLGGFLLITFAPLISYASIAQWTLIIVAGLSTLISALVMMTRISVKVRLAWSTCAQMGLMLIECALGLYELALLHLLTHSLYKAYAFLSAGETVQEYSLRQLAPQKRVTLPVAIVSLSVAVSATAGIVVFTNYQGPASIWLLVSMALSLYLITALGRGSSAWASATMSVSMMLAFYLLGKSLMAGVMPELPVISTFHPIDIWLSVVLISLFALSMLIRLFPHARQTQTLYRWLFSGLYLDEIMTRLTLQLWPVILRPKLYRNNVENQAVKEFSV